MSTITIQHPSLGEITGNQENGVAQFLGLRYASLKDRLAPPELYSGSSQDIVDATHHGPTVISPPQGCDMEFSLIQQNLPKPPFPGISDTRGLNLNIFCPVNARPLSLPVLVFIHGGGFQIGSNWWPQYDLRRLVLLSIEIGQPIVGVGINYRLGVPGFLTSKELRDAGYKANNGLLDQRTALKWIREHIAQFGGDPARMTCMGESAGGISTLLAQLSEEPLFSQAISLGGTPVLFPPIPEPMAEATYGKVLEALGLHHLPAPERVDGILTMAPEELLQKVGKENILMPALDSATFPHPMDFASMESWRAPWCGPLLIVDSQLDGSIFAYAGLLERQIRIGEAFSASLHRTLSSFQSVATSLLSHYNITPDTPDVDVLASIIQFATDIKFYAPAQRAAQKWSANSYLAHFNEPNSWEGLFKDKASHILDVAFLMQNFSDRLNPAQVQIGVDFARDVINFVNGKAPWPQYREEYSARVYGPSQHRGSAYVAETDPVSARDGTIFEIVGEAGLDLVSNAFGVFLAGL